MIALLDPILKNNEVYAMQAKFDLVDFTVDNVNKVPLCTAYEERIRKVASMNDPKYFFSNANVLGKIGIQSSFETDSKNRCNVVSMYRGKTRRFAVCEDELKQDMTTLGNVLIIQDNLIPKHHQERPPTVKVTIILGCSILCYIMITSRYI